MSLELGGKPPDIVFADADLEQAVPGAGMAVFANSGQICSAGTRLFVEQKIYAEFTARVAEFSKSLKVGNSSDPATQVGPLVSTGAEQALVAKTKLLLGGPASMAPQPGNSAATTIFLTDSADALLYYCSGAEAAAKEVPGLVSLPVPDIWRSVPSTALPCCQNGRRRQGRRCSCSRNQDRRF